MIGRRQSRPDGAAASGQALVELALVLPILVTLLLGTVDVGRIIFAYIALEEAVQEGASYAGAIAPTTPTDRRDRVAWRVQNSSDHPEVQNAVVEDVTCHSSGSSAGLVTVRASYGLPLITPVGEAIFGGTFTLRTTVTSTNIQATCT